MKLILECPEEKVELEIIALGINLAANKRNAELMFENGGQRLLMRRALKTKDSLLLKMLRVVSQHEGATKSMFVVRGKLVYAWLLPELLYIVTFY